MRLALNLSLALGLVLTGWTPAYAARCFQHPLSKTSTRSQCCCDGPSSAVAPCRATSCRSAAPSASVTAEAPGRTSQMSTHATPAAATAAHLSLVLNSAPSPTSSPSFAQSAPPAKRYLLACTFRL
ncbi:MAG: hypothetical protein HYY90_02550 [Candidatus Omnitrophica bacterium]|nr:hypothetical protein [Candidatus Omnitrophota bacterium]MBI3021440.1 hypothetical protein [Candidatus Omnitrophota bacterium]MBI3083229.1 hypothetical protein [Candidatus Omnitrophota bacterium]